MMNLNVHSTNFTADEKLVKMITDKTAKLDKFNDTITRVDVYLKVEGTKSIRDKIVEMKVTILKDSTFTKNTSTSFEAALSAALRSTTTQLKRKKEILKGI